MKENAIGNSIGDSVKIKIGRKNKIGLVCSGGGSKAALFHSGVCKALEEAGFQFRNGLISKDRPRLPGPMEISLYVGSSAGSIFCACLNAGLSPRQFRDGVVEQAGPIGLLMRTENVFRRNPQLFSEGSALLDSISGLAQLIVRGRFGKILNGDWIKISGLMTTAGIEEVIRTVIPSNRFQDYSADLYIVATQLNHSRKVVFGKFRYEPPHDDPSCFYERRVNISEACAASSAIPVVYAPFPIQSRDGTFTHFIDGEVRDTLSAHVAIDGGADLVIESYTHQPYHSPRETESLADLGISAIAQQTFNLLIEQKINSAFHYQINHKKTIQDVARLCKTLGLSADQRVEICQYLEQSLNCRENVDYIRIFPSPEDRDFILGPSLSRNPKILSGYYESGYRAATEVLSKYDFSTLKGIVPERLVGATKEIPPCVKKDVVSA